MTSDRLVEIPAKDLPVLRDLYKHDWPLNQISFNTIQNFINWLAADPEITFVKIYSLNGDYSDGTYVVVNGEAVIFNTLNESHDRLFTALSLLDYSRRVILHGFVSKLLPVVERFLVSKGIPKEKHIGTKTVWYYLPRAEAEQLVVSPPNGMTFKVLSEPDASTVNDVWPFRRDGSLSIVQALIKFNPSVGLFTSDNELVGWCLRLDLGSLGLLQVIDSYKRKGIGSLCVKYMAKEFAKRGEDTFAPVVEDNTPSRKMFEKIGFKQVDDVYWRVYIPSETSVQNSEGA